MPPSSWAKTLQALTAACFVAACAACGPATKKTSEQGFNVCLTEVASNQANEGMKAKQDALRTCLKTIDQRLQELDEQEERAREETRKLNQAEKTRQEVSWAPAEERYQYCKFYQPEIIAIEKERVRAYGRLTATSQNTSDTETASEAQKNYNAIIKRIDILIPSRMRAGWQLVPDAVNHFKRCDPADFGLTAEP